MDSLCTVCVCVCCVQVDEKTGRVTGTYKTYAVCGLVRAMVSASHDCHVTSCDFLVIRVKVTTA